MTQLDVLTLEPGEDTPDETPESEQEQAPKKPDLSQARSFLTELRPSGFGELLVTDAWLPPVPGPPLVAGMAAGAAGPATPKPLVPDEPPVDRQRAWKQRQEWRELNLLRERPADSYDARTEHFWGQVKEALGRCPEAIVDPYTHFVASFADADLARMGDYGRDAKEYGREGDSLLNLGRTQLAIGRLSSARRTFQVAAKVEPLQPGIWYHLGVASLFARANAEATDAFQRALDQAPGDLRAEAALGVARYHERIYAEAEARFRRTAGPSGLRAACRSLLACSLRMQGKWDEARVELNFLRGGRSERWAMVSQQCADCVERGEQQLAPAGSRRRTQETLKSAVTTGGPVAGLAYLFLANFAEGALKGLLKHNERWWIAIPLSVVGVLGVKWLSRFSHRSRSREFGNYEQGLPCWQTTTWLTPRRSEF